MVAVNELQLSMHRPLHFSTGPKTLLDDKGVNHLNIVNNGLCCLYISIIFQAQLGAATQG